MSATKLLDEYIRIRKEILEFFGYKRSWRTFEIDDCRDYFWRIEGNLVRFSSSKEQIENEEGYLNVFYPYNETPVFSKGGFTMICLDTQTDGNIFLSIFDDSKRI